jgi:N-acetylglutamate synthase-like GNAT family acetyltransferase
VTTTIMDDFHLQLASKENLVAINQFYVACGYQGSATQDDQVVAALRGKSLVGCMRISRQQDTQVIRGMQVRGKYQYQGIGRAMMNKALELLNDDACYCVPFVHLVNFFTSYGFREIDPQSAPDFLMQRLNVYRGMGQKMVLMRREAKA